MLSRQHQILLLGGVIGTILIIAGLVSAAKNKPVAPVSREPVTVAETVTPEVPAETPPEGTKPTTTPVKKPATPTPAPVQTYDQIVESYKASGYRFQFSGCSGSPGSITIKKGLKLMMDNRDNASHAFVVGSQRFTLGKYGYKIITATELGSLNITCDGRGSATLNVQP